MSASTVRAVVDPLPAKRYSRFAWLLFTAVCLAIVLTISLSPEGFFQPASIFERVSNLTWTLLPAAFAFTGALIVSRQPQNRIGWLLLGPAVLLSLISGLTSAVLSSGAPFPQPTFPNLLVAWMQGWSWLILIFPLLFILLTFPTGKPLSARWRWVLYYAVGKVVLFILFATFTTYFEDVNDSAWMISNPIGFIPVEYWDYFGVPWVISLLLLAISAVASMFIRYRRAQVVERQQIKWLVYAAGIFIVCYAPLGLLSDQQLQENLVLDSIFSISVLLFPAAIAIAILRHRLWEIDIIIRKTLSYSALTASLALVFFGSILLLQQIFGAVAGYQDTPIVIVLSTLAIASLFMPLRRFIQESIDRRFFRSKYDARQILQQFSPTTRNLVEMEQLGSYLVTVVEDTLQPETISLWLVDRKKPGADRESD